MFIRPAPVSVVYAFTPTHHRSNPPPAVPPRAPVPSTTIAPPATSAELVNALVRAGGVVLARQPHGVMVQIRKRLVFVHAAHWVTEATMTDALRAAGLTPARFAELRETA
ncbi:MAG TPA: hypothetical protein VIF09_26875 [Polyangiaceae bacterium]|jgi:hypothetical protein